jgi:hypothetical protein
MTMQSAPGGSGGLGGPTSNSLESLFGKEGLRELGPRGLKHE